MAAEDKALKLTKGRKNYQVSFNYHPGLVALIARVPGAEFKSDKDAWEVPLTSVNELEAALPKMKKLEDLDRAARAEIESMAAASAKDLMAEEGVKGIAAKISDYHEKDKNIRGEVINVNGHYAAQFTGFGKDDGAAFVTLHRLASLTAPVFKGDDVVIKYDAKGRGQVSPGIPSLSDSLGKEVYGVKVVEKDGVYHISFDYNTAMAKRLQRVAEVKFIEEAKNYEVPVTMHPFVARAVADMRRTFIHESEAEQELRKLAENKLDGAKVVKPLVKGNGHGNTGEIIGENDIFVLQHTGKEFFVLHRRSDLDRSPEIGKPMRVQYQDGRGRVSDLGHSRSLAHSH
jgi:hypothetical protein